MVTSAVFYHILNFFNFAIDVRNVCVFLAPLFSSFTTIVTYLLTKELKVSNNNNNLGFTQILKYFNLSRMKEPAWQRKNFQLLYRHIHV